MWDCKNAKYKDHVPYKKQKPTKIEESYICIDCLEVSLKGNRGENIHLCVGKIIPAKTDIKVGGIRDQIHQLVLSYHHQRLKSLHCENNTKVNSPLY